VRLLTHLAKPGEMHGIQSSFTGFLGGLITGDGALKCWSCRCSSEEVRPETSGQGSLSEGGILKKVREAGREANWDFR